MMPASRLTMFAILLGALASPAALAADASPDAYTVAVYDPERDPNADLEATLARATAEDKRILLVVGGDWCVWCKILEKFIADNEAVAEALAADYLIMKVDYAADGRNGQFLAGYPEAGGYPHFYVLDKSGAFVHSQNTVELEAGESYDLEVFLAFLARWA